MTGTPAGVGDLNIGDCVSIVCDTSIPPCQFVEIQLHCFHLF